MTGRWVSPVEHDRTRPVMILREWNLTGSNRTLRSSVRSLRSSASDYHLTVGIGRSVFEERGHVACIARPNACPVDMTGVSGHLVLCPVKRYCLHLNLEKELQGFGSSRHHIIKESATWRSELDDSDAALESAFFK